jgi:hypothetical protein
VLHVQIVLQVQTLSHVQTVPTTVRVLSLFDSPPGFTAPTVMVLQTQTAPWGSAAPAGSQIVLQVQTRSQVHTAPLAICSFWS